MLCFIRSSNRGTPHYHSHHTMSRKAGSDMRQELTSISHNDRSTFSSNVGSVTWIESPGTVEIVSRRSRVDALSLHFGGGAETLLGDSKLGRGGEVDFDGADGASEASESGELMIEVRSSFPDGVEDMEGRLKD